MYILYIILTEVEKNMCYVSATELKKNLSYYLEKSKTEDVYITKNKKVISILMNPQMKAYLELKAMIEQLDIDRSINMTDEEIILEAIDKK